MKNLYQALSALLFACTVTATHAQITFTDMGSMLQSIGTTSYADCAADMDGDGDLDIVLGLEGGHALWINNGQGVFADESRARIRHRDFPGGMALRRPALVLAMLWFRLRDLLS